jgi:hypothetical protein
MDTDMAMYTNVIEQVAQYLAKFPLKHKVHEDIVPDLWTRVGEIRDERVGKAKEFLDAIIIHPDFYSDTGMRENASTLQAFIKEQEGQD